MKYRVIKEFTYSQPDAAGKTTPITFKVGDIVDGTEHVYKAGLQSRPGIDVKLSDGKTIFVSTEFLKAELAQSMISGMNASVTDALPAIIPDKPGIGTAAGLIAAWGALGYVAKNHWKESNVWKAGILGGGLILLAWTGKAWNNYKS
ncbi:MAG: hypothetical protein AAB649_04790 [Patescibacteria group bacterium]|mgnify:CR=1 FL=1